MKFPRISLNILDHLGWMIVMALVGTPICIIGHVNYWHTVEAIGGWMTAPITIVAGVACAIPLLMFPVFPIGGLAAMLPSPWCFFVYASALVILPAWWLFWWIACTGGYGVFN
jgi:hypothetical protein